MLESSSSNKQKKALVLCQAHECNVSGANIALLEYLDALKNEYNFHLILPHNGTMELETAKRGIPSTVIHQYGWTNRFRLWRLDLIFRFLIRTCLADRKLKSLMRNLAPSMVWTNTLVPFQAAYRAKLENIPHVWWIHEFGKEDFGFEIAWTWEKQGFAWMQKSSVLIVANSIAISEHFKKKMPQAKIITVYQPVSWSPKGKNENQKHARFLMFGQITPSKGHLAVLEAMIQNKKEGKPLYKLHIKGPCEELSYLESLQTLVIQNQLQSFVQFEVGYFVKEEVLPHYEVLIVASRSEAFGRVIVEANKAGLRVLVSNSGGAPELINETNGLLFDNQIELAAALCGERNFPVKSIQTNYDETFEIKKLTSLLKTICS